MARRELAVLGLGSGLAPGGKTIGRWEKRYKEESGVMGCEFLSSRGGLIMCEKVSFVYIINTWTFLGVLTSFLATNVIKILADMTCHLI